MKVIHLPGLSLFFLLLLSACGRGDETPQQAPVVRPVKTLQLEGGAASERRRFPAKVYASKRAELAFRVPGKVIELRVKDGDDVKKGDVLARLDPTDYRLAVNDKQARFDTAKSNYERGKKLIKDGFLSRADFDKLESLFKSARAELKRAKNELAYTTLKAPFDGRVAKRYVEKHEQVLAKQKVFSIQSRDRLDVKFDVPESLMLGLRDRRDADRAEPFVFVRFAGSERRYPLTFKEIATRADEQTRTFEATFTLATPKDLTVLPGMTAEVEVNLGEVQKRPAGVIMVPLSAVFADPAGSDESRVWVVRDDMTLEGRRVEPGNIVDDEIEIRKGLQGNERLVVAGVHYLHEGQKVRLFDGHF